ncbi:MAG: L,D-transpeptidase [Candidatus Levybacteria bacterium]|nr:L,D-transpeptidase [Candidatus Levybacteria bacterium]
MIRTLEEFSDDKRNQFYFIRVFFTVLLRLFFHKAYAIHGAYWHNDFGISRRSSGCINLRIEDAQQVYNWAGPAMSVGVGALNSTDDNPGIKVVVHG